MSLMKLILGAQGMGWPLASPGSLMATAEEGLDGECINLPGCYNLLEKVKSLHSAKFSR